jgi:hypothetical protein
MCGRPRAMGHAYVSPSCGQQMKSSSGGDIIDSPIDKHVYADVSCVSIVVGLDLQREGSAVQHFASQAASVI